MSRKAIAIKATPSSVQATSTSPSAAIGAQWHLLLVRCAVLADEGGVRLGVLLTDVGAELEIAVLAAIEGQLEGLQRDVGDVFDAGGDPPALRDGPATQQDVDRPGEDVGQLRQAA